MIAGVCYHGQTVAGINDEAATEEDLREFAACYRLERRETVTMNGCDICQTLYNANCELLEIEP
jgi:hypothetical protein